MVLRKRHRTVALVLIGLILVSGWLVYQRGDVESEVYPKSERTIQRLSSQHTYHNNKSDIPLIYFITPTGIRTEQKADLTRLSHTLRLVPRLHWIVVEDRPTPSKLIGNLLAKCKMPHTHLAVQTSGHDRPLTKLKHVLLELPRGVDQRNAALEWITKHAEFPSVFYLGDDDNTYDLQLFEEMRYTKKVAVWPVGLVGKAKFQTPVVKNGKVIDWAAGWGAFRKFAIDMAGFAVDTELLLGPNRPRFSKAVKGRVETTFLEQLKISLGELEPKADNCTKFYHGGEYTYPCILAYPHQYYTTFFPSHCLLSHIE